MATMKKEGELKLFPNQLLIVCVKPEVSFQLKAYATDKTITHAKADITLRMYLNLT